MSGYTPWPIVPPSHSVWLTRLLPVLQEAAIGQPQARREAARAAVMLVPGLARHLLEAPVAQLSEVAAVSGLTGFYSLTLLSGVDRRNHLRLNLYPGGVADLDFHSHRTTVTSLVVKGELRNTAFPAAHLRPHATGSHQVLTVNRISDESSRLEPAGPRVDLPLTTAETHAVSMVYQVPLRHLHTVQALTPTVTLCWFAAPEGDHQTPWVLKRVGDAIVEPDRPRVTGQHVRNLRALLTLLTG